MSEDKYTALDEYRYQRRQAGAPIAGAPIVSINGMSPEQWAMLTRIESKLNRLLEILERWNPADDP